MHEKMWDPPFFIDKNLRTGKILNCSYKRENFFYFMWSYTCGNVKEFIKLFITVKFICSTECITSRKKYDG